MSQVAAARLRVALLCPYSLDRPGGVQGQVQGLARSLRSAGHTVLVVAPGNGPTGWRDPSHFVAGHTIGVQANGSVAPVALSPAAPWRVWRALRQWAPDVVHVHEPVAPLADYGVLAGGTWPVVATFHRAGDSAVYRYAAPVLRRLRRRLTVCVAVSEEARRCAAVALGGQFEVLFNGIELDRFSAARASVADGAGYGTPGSPAVLFVGRHEPRKGLSVLLEAWSRVDEPGVLWVVGQGPQTESLRRLHPSGDRLQWLGQVDDEEVAARMASATLLCAPALGGESFGVILLEAMAAGTAVVASDIAGYRQAAGGHALLVAPDDPVALASALASGLGDPPGPAALNAAAAHAAHWSMDDLAGRYVDLYRQAGSSWKASRAGRGDGRARRWAGSRVAAR